MRKAAQRQSRSDCQEGKGPGSRRRGEPSHSRGTMLLCQRRPQSSAIQGEPLADSCIISWPQRPVLQGTWGGLWLHAQNANPISTCLAGICYTKLEINNSSHGMNNSTQGTKGRWHHKAAHGAFQRERGKETPQPGWCLDPKDPDTRQFRSEHKKSMGALGLPEGNSGPYLPSPRRPHRHLQPL